MSDNYSAWDVRKTPFPLTMSARIYHVARYGILAPSAHNAEPWDLDIEDNTLVVRPKSDNPLKDGDPTGRETWISLGAFCENILLAAQAYGLKPSISLDDDIRISFGDDGKDSSDPVLEAISSRHSNRNKFDSRPVPEKGLAKIMGSYSSKEVMIYATSKREIIELVASLSSRAIGMAMTLPELKNELAAMIRTNYTNKYDGITGANMGFGGVRSIFETLRFRMLDISSSESRRERKSILSSGGLVFVFAKGDIKKYWFEAGRAYERASIEATELGLSISTTAAVVEAPDFHQEIEKAVGTKMRLQTVMRLGYCSKKPTLSPRLPIEHFPELH